ncbi:MAG: hypothetical protein KGL59_07400 [Acidobacteriota bacterium]|nr:hypothetical protein [Acidobacteriota bacterium]
MSRAFLLLFVLSALPAAPQTPTPPVPKRAHLAPGLWQKRQALQREFDASGGNSGAAYESIQSIDTQYRKFVLALSDAYEKKQQSVIDSSCDAASNDPEATIFCALVGYRLSGRKDPASFLAALPETPEAAAALVDLRQAASTAPNATGLAASPVYNVTDELFQLVLAGNPGATARYFYLFHHSGGAWADDAADQLEHYLTDHPDALIRNWPVLRKYWNLSEGITWDVDAGWWQDLVAQYRRACSATRPNCREILALLQKAAQAAAPSQ